MQRVTILPLSVIWSLWKHEKDQTNFSCYTEKASLIFFPLTRRAKPGRRNPPLSFAERGRDRTPFLYLTTNVCPGLSHKNVGKLVWTTRKIPNLRGFIRVHLPLANVFPKEPSVTAIFRVAVVCVCVCFFFLHDIIFVFQLVEFELLHTTSYFILIAQSNLFIVVVFLIPSVYTLVLLVGTEITNLAVEKNDRCEGGGPWTSSFTS